MTLAKKMVTYFLLVIVVATAGFAYTIYVCTNAEVAVNDLKGKTPRLQTNNDIAYNAVAEVSNVGLICSMEKNSISLNISA